MQHLSLWSAFLKVRVNSLICHRMYENVKERLCCWCIHRIMTDTLYYKTNIRNQMTANSNKTWAQLKEQLAVRFSDVTDAQMALSLKEGLSKIRVKQFRTTLREFSLWQKRPLIIMGLMRSKDSSSTSLQMDWSMIS